MDNTFWMKVPDTMTFRHVSENLMMIKVPCDYIIIQNGITYFIEAKSSRNPASYSFRYIREHQVTSLLEAEEQGILYKKIGNTLVQLRTVYSYFLINDRSSSRNYKCYAIRVNVLNDLMNNSSKQSVKWTDLKALSIEVPRIGQSWDLSVIFR